MSETKGRNNRRKFTLCIPSCQSFNYRTTARKTVLDLTKTKITRFVIDGSK